MIRKALWAVVGLALTTIVIPRASASSPPVFDLNIDFCSSPCLGGGGGGTVTLTLGTGTSGVGSNGIATGDVKFDVELTDPLHFHQTNGLDAFMFNYGGSQTLSFDVLTAGYGAVQGPTAGKCTTAPCFHEDGAGDFDYILPYGTQPAVDGQSLMFIVSAGSALTLANFETIGGASVDFAANVSNGTCTGLIGGGNGGSETSATTNNPGGSCSAPPPPVPEPTSVLLLGTALMFAGKLLKMKLAV